MLRLGLKAAVERGLALETCGAVHLPKCGNAAAAALSPLEQKRLEQAACSSGSPNDIGVLLCLYTGIRIGEFCALRWENVDLKRGSVYIRHTLQRIGKGGYGTNGAMPPALDAGNQTIALPRQREEAYFSVTQAREKNRETSAARGTPTVEGDGRNVEMERRGANGRTARKS